MAGNADESISPAQKLSTTVATRLSTWGMASEKGAVPRIDAQITYLRPNRSPAGPPSIVPKAVAAKKTNNRICDWPIVTPNLWIR